MFKCYVCGYMQDAKPEKCAKCGSDRFEKLSEETTKNLERARKTNDLHQKLSALADNIVTVSEEGLRENLDPACTAIFTKAREDAKVIKQLVKAEIVIHVNRGKWS